MTRGGPAPCWRPQPASLPRALPAGPFFDVITTGHIDANRSHHGVSAGRDFKLPHHMLYGATDRLTSGCSAVLPRRAFRGGGLLGHRRQDLTLQAGYGLTRVTGIAAAFGPCPGCGRTLPTGNHDQLSRARRWRRRRQLRDRVSLYSRAFWLPSGRILRASSISLRSPLPFISGRDRGVYDGARAFTATVPRR
jgi:hypothetical protein